MLICKCLFICLLENKSWDSDEPLIAMCHDGWSLLAFVASIQWQFFRLPAGVAFE